MHYGGPIPIPAAFQHGASTDSLFSSSPSFNLSIGTRPADGGDARLGRLLSLPSVMHFIVNRSDEVAGQNADTVPVLMSLLPFSFRAGCPQLVRRCRSGVYHCHTSFPTNELVLAFMMLTSSSLPGLKRALRDTCSDYKTMYLLGAYA
jgi:hypothetical protein